MEDIISQGADRPPGGWRRKLVVVAALAAVIALVLVEHLPHGAGTSRRHQSAAGVRRTGHGVSISIPEVPQGPSGIIGSAFPVAAGSRLPRTGAQPDWFWPAKGSIEPIGGLPSDRFGYVFTRVDGGWAIQPDPPGPAGCGDCTGPPVPVYYLGNHAQTATMVGSADQVAPGAASGSLWLTTYPADTGLGRVQGLAREYSGTGATDGPPVRLPAGTAIAAATSRGLLLTSTAVTGQGAVDQLWNPNTRRVTGSFPGVIAASADTIAYLPTCRNSCPVHVLDLVTGHDIALKLTKGNSVTAGVFSPDGRYLALQVSFGDGGDGGALAMQLEVATVRTGKLAIVPHTWVSSDALSGFGWSGDGDSLVAELTFSTRVQVAFWSPASAASLAVTMIRPDQDPTALVLG
jgi:hypothetical protein